MKVVIAKDAGYCFGVRDAVNLAYDTAQKFDHVYMLGDIVHNESVVKDLSAAGAKVVERLEDVPKNKKILFRAHGTKPKVWEKAKKEGKDIIDATCPLVHEIHREVKKLDNEGRRIIIIGDHGHDEVMGIAAQVDKAIIIANPDEAKKLSKAGLKKAGVVTQSTQMIENVQMIINILMTKVYDLRFVNTICFPTKRNHEQIKELATKYDVVIIIGSFTSANSKRLAKLSKTINSRTYQVRCADEIKNGWFRNVSSVGISAGASTPDYLIKDVAEKIKKIRE
ncbi:MAG: 4-hydroxy-3-methylbut-2-enyl diphosphate reductase [Candidatus Marinimicrobia bacterium]|nr:4-hydroxy-3-methylbut-2-enyl diphosphate reductase [Candidatus Neomarinimicrobiota bacterium]|tara:strand:+ start:1398 stop:2240 length:843 start_codon:yes stop_codon:yes gene_type:complete